MIILSCRPPFLISINKFESEILKFSMVEPVGCAKLSAEAGTSGARVFW